MAGTELASYEDRSDYKSLPPTEQGRGATSITGRLTSFFTGTAAEDDDGDAAEDEEIKRVMEEAAAVRDKAVSDPKEEYRREKQPILDEDRSHTQARMKMTRELQDERIADAYAKENATIAAAVEAVRVKRAEVEAERARRSDAYGEWSRGSDGIQRTMEVDRNHNIMMMRKAAAKAAAEAAAAEQANAEAVWTTGQRLRVIPSNSKPEKTFLGRIFGSGGRTRKRKHHYRSKKTKTIQRRRKSYARKSTNKRRRSHKRFTRRY